MCCRAEIALTDGRLMAVTRELNTTAEQEEALKRLLSDLERELRDLNTTVARKQQQLIEHFHSGFAGNKLIQTNDIRN